MRAMNCCERLGDVLRQRAGVTTPGPTAEFFASMKTGSASVEDDTLAEEPEKVSSTTCMLVFGTLHTNSAPKTIDRIIDSFPSDAQLQARVSLAESLAGIVAQLLLPTADGAGRRAVNEILIKTKALPNLIREGNTSMLTSYIQSGRGEGMQAMDDALFALAESGDILPRDAYMKATEKKRFEPLLPQE